MKREDVLSAVYSERARQRKKWGDQSNRHPLYWMVILSEEHGELAKALLNEKGKEALKEELIQVAAVCVAWLEEGFD